MAGMAWTLHPALFYEKYGTVLVQLWDSGAIGTLFRPVRRLSRSIGDAIAARRRGSAGAEPVVDVQEEPSMLQVTDESVPTSDEAQCRAYCIPGDTTSSPSSSEENELAFQGDVYTQMRRTRRQKERLKKIREARQQFLESSSSGSAKRRRSRRRRQSSFVPSKVRDMLRRDFDGTGTPLTEMEGPAEEPRVIIIDAPDVSSPASPPSELNEDAKGGTPEGGAGIVKRLDVAQLRGDNDSLRKFRAITGRKKASVSPPPGVMSDHSDSATNIDLGAGSSHAITPDELLPDNDSLRMFKEAQEKKGLTSPSVSADSSVQAEPAVELAGEGRPAHMITADELIPDNDSLNKFRATHEGQKGGSPSTSEASGPQESVIDLRGSGRRAHSITPSELRPDNDSLRKFRAAHPGKSTSSPPTPAGVSEQSESQTESQPIAAEGAAGSVAEAHVPDSRGVTVSEGKTLLADGKRKALRKAPGGDTPKDGSSLSKQTTPPEKHALDQFTSRDEVSSSSLKGAKKKTKAAHGDRAQAKKARRKTEKKKSRFSTDAQNSSENTSGMEAICSETTATRSNITTRSSSAASVEGMSERTRPQLQGPDVDGKRGKGTTGTRSSSEALPFGERYAEIPSAPDAVRVSASGTFDVGVKSTRHDQSSAGYSESEDKKEQGFETSLATETGERMEQFEGGHTGTTQGVAVSELAGPTEAEVHESEMLGPTTSAEEITGKHRRKSRSAKWGSRVIKRHRKQLKRHPPVSPGPQKDASPESTSPRPSLPGGTATEGSQWTPSPLSAASHSEGTSGHSSRRHSARRRSKGHGSKGSEGRHGKSRKDSGKKAEAEDASTSRAARADAVLPETTEEVSGSGPPLRSSSTVPTSGVMSETATKGSVPVAQTESGRSGGPSSCGVLSASTTVATPGTANSGSTSRDKPPQGKDVPRQGEEGPSRRNKRLSLWPFRRKQ
ncbi:hypothetical protein HPB50_021818 [Hyalomma asiaticum]|uniref:Uncharacterized protein n=1 Tax=Hyalomma asiaticum TaxID=266040 RepID=A0ACB7RNY4_HYAAI|nr:hypothetical protein HPB50_021818 [Hyalomma asiaticum]